MDVGKEGVWEEKEEQRQEKNPSLHEKKNPMENAKDSGHLKI